MNYILRNKSKYCGVAILGAVLLWSCVIDYKKIKDATNRDLPSSIIEDFTNAFMDSGWVQTKIISPKMIEYNNAIRQYREFPNGITVFTLEKDTIVTGFFRSDYAIMNTSDSAIWEGRGNVLLVSRNNDSIFSQHMIWDSHNNKIHSDILTEIKKYNGGEIISQSGFTAKLSPKGMEEYQLKANSGKLLIKDVESEDYSKK